MIRQGVTTAVMPSGRCEVELIDKLPGAIGPPRHANEGCSFDSGPPVAAADGCFVESLGEGKPYLRPLALVRPMGGVLAGTGWLLPVVAATARRLELGRAGVEHQLVQTAGEFPTSGLEKEVPHAQTKGRKPKRAVLATTIPVTLRRFYSELVGMLRADGYDVTLVSSSGPHLDAAAAETGARAEVIEMSRHLTPLQDLLAWLKWHAVMARHRPAIVVAGTPKGALLGMTVAALWRVPRRVYLCGGLRLEGSAGPLKQILVWTERLAMAAATEVMVNSNTLKQEVLAASLVRPAKLRQTIPGSTHGVDSKRFSPRARDAELSASLGIDPRTPVLGFVGRLTRDKGIQTLIEAGLRLQRQGRPFQLLIVGPQNEPDSKEYIDRLHDSGLAVALAGPVDDVRPYYSLMYVHLLPSLREGFPNVVLEASAMGVPTVTTTATGCRDSVLDGKTGILCPPADAEAFSRAIARLLDDADLRAYMGSCAREWAAAQFEPQRIVGQWLYAPLRRGVGPPRSRRTVSSDWSPSG